MVCLSRSAPTTQEVTVTRPAAATFARTVAHVAVYPVGIDTCFGLGSALIQAWRPAGTSATWVFTLAEVDADLEEVHQLGTVSVVPTPGPYFTFDVISGDGTVVLADEFKNIEAAIGFAFDELCAPVWRTSQSAPDPVGV
jgi:hypothetical protein